MTSSPHSLHRLTHRASDRERGADGWWGSPLVTALAAVSAVHHPPSHRARGVQALDALERWWRNGTLGRVSGDGVALCLAARTAAALGRTNERLTLEAVARTADMSSRHGVVPDLHLALAAWALDELVPDRTDTPWPSLREATAAGNPVGIHRALCVYTKHVAAVGFDPAGLVRELTASGIGVMKPALDDGAVLLWLLTAAIGKAAPRLRDDNALLALVDQRTDLVSRLELELDEETFLTPQLSEFDLDEQEGHVAAYLSPMEALLMDLALASPERESSWFTFEEARALFGEREAAERTGRMRWQTWTATALFGGGLVASAATLLFARYIQGADQWVSAWIAMFVLCGISVCAARLWRSSSNRPELASALVTFAATAFLCTGLLTVNTLLPNPLLPDAAGIVLSLVLPTVVSVLAAHTTTRRS